MTDGSDQPRAWFDEAFGTSYIDLYAHRDDRSARNEILHVLSRLPVSGRALDLACGEGRHTRALRRYGWSVVGLDRSWPLLREGVKKSVTSVVRGDMRSLPFASASFSLVIQMFTAFGYFPTLEENIQVLREVRRVLANGGIYLLDYLDANWIRAHLQAHTEREFNGVRCLEDRTIEGKRLKKRVRWADASGRVRSEYEESVMLFEPDELTRILEQQGLEILRSWGDFQGTPYLQGQRCIHLARRAP